MRALPVLWLLYLVATKTLTAQWHVGIELATTRYGGSARDTSAAHLASQGRPGDATAIGIRLDKRARHLGVAVRAAYAVPGFAIAGSDINATDKSTGDLIEFAALLSTRVGGVGSSGAIRAELGPSLHLWRFDDDFRTRVSALGFQGEDS